MVGALALLLAVQSAAPAESVDVPLDQVQVPNLLFVCRAAGLPSVGIDYDEMHREMDFGRYNSPVTQFTLDDPIKSVTFHERAGRWVIRAEGSARHAEGLVAEGTPARIILTLILGADGTLGTADFVVEAGSFRQENTGCGLAPPRPRPGHGLTARPASGQPQ